MSEAHLKDVLGCLLASIRAVDPSADRTGINSPEQEQRLYETRNAFVWDALSAAASLKYPHGILPDPEAAGWVVAFIDLPGCGQVSWHLPTYSGTYDGHTTVQKYERTRQYITSQATWGRK